MKKQNCGNGIKFISENIWTIDKCEQFWNEHEGEFASEKYALGIIKLSRKVIGERILDIGAGSGELINKLPNAVGIDLSPKHPDVIRGSITKLFFKDKSFDTIFAIEIFEHLDNETLQNGLKEIYRILNDDGHLILTVPYKENLKNELVLCPKCGLRFHRWGHVQTFDEIRIKEILEDNNLQIREIKCIPLGLVGKHRFLKYFRFFLEKFGFFKSKNIYAVAVKRKKNKA